MSRKGDVDAAFAVKLNSPELMSRSIEPLRVPPKDTATVLGAPNEAANMIETVAPPNRPLGAPNDQMESTRVRTGAISAMGASLRQLNESAKVAALVDAGAAVVDLDPSVIDRSFISDRLTDAIDLTFEALVESIRTSGQQVPILVRPSPDAKGRYQVAYGHRRLAAAQRLRVSVKAIVRNLNDVEMVIAQGKENLERRDLSFIERAVFALRLEQLNFDRSVIVQAMVADKSDVSRYISVAKALPPRIIQAVGPAPKTGRARWLSLVDRLQGRDDQVTAALNDPSFVLKSSDARFAAILTALSEPIAKKPEFWTDPKGRKLVRIEHTGHRFNLSIDAKMEPGFGEFLKDRLPELYAQFEGK